MKRYLYFSQNCQILEIPHFMHERIQKFFPGGSESKVGGGRGYTNHQKSNKKNYVYYARVYLLSLRDLENICAIAASNDGM